MMCIRGGGGRGAATGTNGSGNGGGGGDGGGVNSIRGKSSTNGSFLGCLLRHDLQTFTAAATTATAVTEPPHMANPVIYLYNI